MRSMTIGGILWLIGVSTVGGSAFAAEDPYIKALQAEAHALSPDKATTKDSAPSKEEKANGEHSWATTPELGGSVVPPNLSQEQFEETLKSSFFGTYMFYSKLTDPSKAVVYEEYKSNNQINNVRDKIKSLLK